MSEVTRYRVTRLVGAKREYLVGAPAHWVEGRENGSAWDTEDGARHVAKATHDARACVERFTETVVIGDPVYSATA
jgi:hypothetical protein